MKKIDLILLILLFLVLFAVLNREPTQSKTSQQKTLSELQIAACNSADEAKTCDTRLPEIGIVLKEDCCEALGKCC